VLFFLLLCAFNLDGRPGAESLRNRQEDFRPVFEQEVGEQMVEELPIAAGLSSLSIFCELVHFFLEVTLLELVNCLAFFSEIIRRLTILTYFSR
jgi:hypothetical protein